MTFSKSADLALAYKKITKNRFSYGRYYKTVFHLHTPASYDYRLFENWTDSKYKELTQKEMFNICIKRKLLPDSFKLEDIKLLNGNEDVYCNIKEALSYLLLAYELAESGIELVTLADHNTIVGYNKLKKAIANLKRLMGEKEHYYPTIILGVEVSCADKLHVAAFFEDNCYDDLDQWLNESLVTITEGSYLTSLDVLKYLNEDLGGIAYIAHINTSDIFKSADGKFLSKGYKKKLFNSNYCKLVGIKDINKINQIKSLIVNNSNNRGEIKFLYDNDSHSIDDLTNRISWVKGAECSFNMLKSAVLDYDVSIILGGDSLPLKRSYIKGLYLEGNGSFLKNKKEDGFVLGFSNGLNCLIGGRGTGKSTVIEILEYIISQRCASLTDLNFICSHGNMWLLYIYEDIEYMVEMLTPYIDGYEYDGYEILDYFYGRAGKEFVYKKREFKAENIKTYAAYHYFTVYKVVHDNGEARFQSVNNKNILADKFFDRKYSVNELVSTASDSRITNFIFDLMLKNKKIKNFNELIRFKKIEGFKKALSESKGVLNKRKSNVESIINPFNNTMNNKLKITYSQSNSPTYPDFKRLLNILDKKGYYFYNQCDITIDNLIDYLQLMCDRYGVIQAFMEMFDCLKFNKYDDVILMFVENNKKNFDTDFVNEHIDETTYAEFLELLYSKILSEKNVDYLKDYLKECLNEMESFTIEFNVNSKQGGSKMPIFKDIKQLSLGQKVVTMLDFILGYSDYSSDYRPLIIDQPEDNLDSRYIYEHLAKELRKAKSKRQVIIATHNSTIVTNAMSDLVIVMESDGRNGWVDKKGYPGEKFIKEKIVNCLEGGIDSFLHKVQTYQEILNSKK